MSKEKEFLSFEKNKFGKIFVDLTYAVDNISPFLNDEILKKRKYYVKLPILKKYIDILDSLIIETNKRGIFHLFSGNNSVDLVKDYKRVNSLELTQLEKCSTCRCLNCTSDCRFNSCMGCRHGSRINYCDHTKINITSHDNYILNLTNDRTGIADKYIVLATLQDCKLNKKYIIIKNITTEEKFVLYYYPGLIEDSYGEISNTEEFDFIVTSFESNFT